MILTKGKIDEINIDSFIEQKILSNKLDSLLIIVPTNRKLRDQKKKIIDYFKTVPFSGIHIETLTTLSGNILMQHLGFIPLSEAAASVLIKESTEYLELSYFGSYSKGIPFGTLDRIKNVISEYKRHGITPADILNESDRLSKGERAKAFDLAGIFEQYSKKCRELSAFEVGDIYNSLIELNIKEFSKYFRKRYENVETIILYGFDELTAIEMKLLEMLSELVDNDMLINLDYYRKNKQIFSHLDDIHSNLIKIGFRKINDITPAEKSRFRDTIRKRLFKESNNQPVVKYRDKAFKISAKSRVEEIESIAKIIKNKIIEDKIEPHKICAAFNSIAKYTGLVRDIFGKYGIPINLTDRIPLKSSQPVIAAINILELAAGDFYYKDLIRVLTNKFLIFDDIDLNNLIYTANNLKIIRGLENWETSINDAVKLLEFRDDLTDENKKVIVNKYSRAKRDIRKIAELIKPLKGNKSKKEFQSSLKKITLSLKLPMNVLNNSSGKEEEFTKSLTVFLNTLEEVFLLIDSKNENKKYSLHYFLDNIKTISNWARFNVKEKSDQGVLVTSINEIRGLKFDLLFLGGMVDGDFPTKYSPEIFFPDTFQKKELVHQTEERYHFYQSLCCWDKELYLSVPRNDAETELVESTFIKDLSKSIELTEINEISKGVIYSKEELLEKYMPDGSGEIKAYTADLGLNTELIDQNILIRRNRKSEPFGKFEYSGFIGGSNDHIAEFLKNQGEKQFSVTQLETYAKCPFKYFSERVLKLKSIEEPKEEVEPIELGNVLHSILYQFYKDAADEDMEFGPPGSRQFKFLEESLFGIAERTINSLNLNSPLAFFEKEKILGINGVRENSILYKFLKTEFENEGSFKPFLFEHGFGLDKRNKNTVLPFYLDDLILVGKIDRIDIDQDRKLFNVIDYKLRGNKPSVKDLQEGLSLQLPVYLKAGEKIIEHIMNEKYRGYRMMVYSLDFKEDNFGPLLISLSRKRKLDAAEILALNDEQNKTTSGKIKEYYSGIVNGEYNLSELDDREEKVCKYCDYRSLCRVKEVFEE